jgi:hypothetical protein
MGYQLEKYPHGIRAVGAVDIPNWVKPVALFAVAALLLTKMGNPFSALSR